jgi:branched-chain amino acid transport system substrate-binding protein
MHLVSMPIAARPWRERSPERARLSVAPLEVQNRCGFQPLRFALNMGATLSATCIAVILAMAGATQAQTSFSCSCGDNPPGRPAQRSLKPYTGAPDDLRPFSKFTPPYYEFYQDLVEYNGAARDIPDPELKDLAEIRIGFLAPLYDHPDQVLGERMLQGARMAIDEANDAGGYGGKPFRLITHNDYDNWQNNSTFVAGASRDSAIWGAASNDAVRMIYDDKVWAMFGSISSESTHIALRLTLKGETPLVNSASTDPTIPETIIPWYFTVIQDDRLQGYTLARHIYSELGIKRVAILRVNDRYGRFGVLKFKDASRRLGHAVVVEQKFMRGDTDFRRQLQVIEDSNVDAIVLWTDVGPAAMILQQMQELGMEQRVFGSHRTISEELIKLAGPAADNFEAVFPYDPTRNDPYWLEFNTRYEAQYHEKADQFAALAYDQMRILLDAICRAGLNKGRIRDALTGLTRYKGVTGEMVFDPNCKNISPLFLAHVRNGQIQYRRMTLQKPYARVGEGGVQYTGPLLPDQPDDKLRIAVFGPRAEQTVSSPEIAQILNTSNVSGKSVSLIAIPSATSWGTASTNLVRAIYHDHVLAVIALDRSSSHLAEQIAVKTFLPVIAISSDRSLTSSNIPWIFRLPEGTPLANAVRTLSAAIEQAGANRGALRAFLASGKSSAGVRFDSAGEATH